MNKLSILHKSGRTPLYWYTNSSKLIWIKRTRPLSHYETANSNIFPQTPMLVVGKACVILLLLHCDEYWFSLRSLSSFLCLTAYAIWHAASDMVQAAPSMKCVHDCVRVRSVPNLTHVSSLAVQQHPPSVCQIASRRFCVYHDTSIPCPSNRYFRLVACECCRWYHLAAGISGERTDGRTDGRASRWVKQTRYLLLTRTEANT